MHSRRIWLGLAVFFFLKTLYSGALRPALMPVVHLPDFPGGILASALPLVLFSVAHAIYAIGWRHMLAFFALGAVIPWALEQLGVVTGWVYGGYSYGEALGVKLGSVPVLIPLSWFTMLYSSYVVTNCMIGDDPVGSRGRPARIIWVSLLSGVVMSAQDLVIDPILSGPIFKAWTWERGGAYFGVPAQNYVGWIVTSFIVYVIYRLIESSRPPRPLGPMTKAVTSMPLVMYGLLMLAATLSIAPPPLAVIGPFVLGLPLLVAITRLWFPPEKSLPSVQTRHGTERA